MAEYRINVTELDEGGKSYDFPVRTAWLAETLGDRDGDVEIRPDSATSEVGRVHFDAHMMGDDVMVRGEVHTSLVTSCVRCLGDARIPVDTELTALFEKRGAQTRATAGLVDLTPEDLDREFYTGDLIDLDDTIREQILLEVPMQPICSEDCPGLAVPEHVRGPAQLDGAETPTEGDDAIDPRLAPLRALLAKPTDDSLPKLGGNLKKATPSVKHGPSKKARGR